MSSYFENLFSIRNLEIVITIVGLATSFLTIKQKIIRWPIDILITSLNLYLHHKIHLYDRWIFAFFIIINDIYGWYLWKYGGANKSKLRVTKMSSRYIISLVLFGMVASMLLSQLLIYLNSSLVYLSSFRTIFSIIALILSAKKKIENWIFWIIYNALNIKVFFDKGLYLFSWKYFIYIFLCIYGFISWYKSMRKYNK